jgi:hypothetical protein
LAIGQKGNLEFFLEPHYILAATHARIYIQNLAILTFISSKYDNFGPFMQKKKRVSKILPLFSPKEKMQVVTAIHPL